MEHWDGTESLPYVYDDGGRANAGYKGDAGDCVARSIAIAACMPYEAVYEALAHGNGTQRASKRSPKRARSARNGIQTRREWFKRYMRTLGFEWHATMHIGSGCKVHLLRGELPETGRLVVALSRHYTAVIDGTIHDTYDPSRVFIMQNDDGRRLVHRCVYGYWRIAE